LNSGSYGNSLDKKKKSITGTSAQEILNKITAVTASAPKVLEIK
jgi:hypothetical protein